MAFNIDETAKLFLVKYKDKYLKSIPSDITGLFKQAGYLLQSPGTVADYLLFKGIKLFQNMRDIPDKMFKGSTQTRDITIPWHINSMGEEIFANSNFRSVTIESDCNIPRQCFVNCKQLKQVIIPEGCTTIESEAFKGCTSLQKLWIPKSVTKIQQGAFDDCSDDLLIVTPYRTKSNQLLRFPSSEEKLYRNILRFKHEGKEIADENEID